jgi:hypothetical protein
MLTNHLEVRDKTNDGAVRPQAIFSASDTMVGNVDGLKMSDSNKEKINASLPSIMYTDSTSARVATSDTNLSSDGRPPFPPPFMPHSETVDQTFPAPNSTPNGGPGPTFRPTTGASSLESLSSNERQIPPPPFGPVWGPPQQIGPK